MAGGKGTRLNSTDKPKVMFEIEGKPMIDYALAPLLELKHNGMLDEIIVVVGFLGQMVADHLKGYGIKLVWQDEQLGTAHAVMQAREHLENKQGTTLVINGDHPLYDAQTLEDVMKFREQNNLTVGFGVVDNPTEFDDYGRVIRDEDGKIIEIREKLDCSAEELKITERNPNLYAIDNAWLWQAIDKIKTDNAKGEFYLTDIIKVALDDGEKIETAQMRNSDGAYGVNTKEDLSTVTNILKSRKG